jgi:enterochelin esterase-like enzyme
MMTNRPITPLLLILLAALLIAACDPLTPIPTPTPQIIIVTPEFTATPPPTETPRPTETPTPTPTSPATPTPTPLPCASERGQWIVFDDNRSEVAGENLRYRVYVPPCYFESQRRYPYVILLHGLRYTELQWDEVGVDEALEQALRINALGPMLLVLPFFGRIGTANTFPPDPSYLTVLLEELVPAVERDFCVIQNRAHRAIGGISRGGFWAYLAALRNPDVFGIVGGHSAELDPESAPPQYDPLELATNAEFLRQANLRMYLDNAASDPAGRSLELFSSRLSARGIAHTYVINPTGDHSNDYWSAHVSEYLSFYGRDWPRSLGELPSCLEPSP